MVHVSHEIEAGNNFEFSTGTGVNSWNQTEFDRNLLKFEPATVALDESTPATYNLIITNTDTLHSDSFPSTNNLLVELICSDNETIAWGQTGDRQFTRYPEHTMCRATLPNQVKIPGQYSSNNRKRTASYDCV